MAARDPETMRELREEVVRVQGVRCAMPACDNQWTDLAHIQGRGMGGVASRDVLDNVAGLCRGCHDVFDGRQPAGRQVMLRRLLAAHVITQRARVLPAVSAAQLAGARVVHECHDSTCPGHDGDPCHYEGPDPMTKTVGWLPYSVELAEDHRLIREAGERALTEFRAVGNLACLCDGDEVADGHRCRCSQHRPCGDCPAP